MRRSVGRAAIYGVLLGVASAAVAEAVRPRGGTAVLVDWEAVRRIARSRLDDSAVDSGQLAAATKGYRQLAAPLEKPLLDFVAASRAARRCLSSRRSTAPAGST